MEYTIIQVPDMNDSISRIVLNGTVYMIRFTYNDSKGYWKFGLYSAQNEPLLVGVKIVPNFPLNLFYSVSGCPEGIFGVKTTLERIGRNDFASGKAEFIFCPVEITE